MYKILIVEDEELERTSMKIFLEENLLDVEIVGEAKSGFEAVEMIDSKDINLMLNADASTDQLTYLFKLK